MISAFQSILACPMCLSGAEGQTLVAANASIGALLSILVVVLASFLGFIFVLARRAIRFGKEHPAPGSQA